MMNNRVLFGQGSEITLTACYFCLQYKVQLPPYLLLSSYDSTAAEPNLNLT